IGRAICFSSPLARSWVGRAYALGSLSAGAKRHKVAPLDAFFARHANGAARPTGALRRLACAPLPDAIEATHLLARRIGRGVWALQRHPRGGVPIAPAIARACLPRGGRDVSLPRSRPLVLEEQRAMARMTGGEAIVDGLLRHGIDVVFGL